MKNNRSAFLGLLLPGLAAIAVAAVLVAWQWPSITGNVTRTARSGQTGTATPEAAAADAAQPFAGQAQHNGLGRSADHVRVTALRRGDTLVAHLTIDAGWHINANPASLDFLIPTQLSVRSNNGPLSAAVNYPQGHTIDVGLEQPITVYSHEARITAKLPDNAPAAALQAAVRVQACSNKGRCLMPSTLEVPVLAAQGT